MQGDTTKPMMKIKRELKINKSKSFFLFGPRQVGKSTFLKENFQSRDSLYFNFLLNEEYEKYLLDKSLQELRET
jgi:predicted AAA+ superfamily ATPase